MSQSSPFFNQLQLNLKDMFDSELILFKEKCNKYFQKDLESIFNNIRDEIGKNKFGLIEEPTNQDIMNKLMVHEILLGSINNNLQYLISKINELDALPKIKTYVGATPEYNQLASLVSHWLINIEKRINEYEIKPKQYYTFFEEGMSDLKKQRDQFLDIVNVIKTFEINIEERINELEKNEKNKTICD